MFGCGTFIKSTVRFHWLWAVIILISKVQYNYSQLTIAPVLRWSTVQTVAGPRELKFWHHAVANIIESLYQGQVIIVRRVYSNYLFISRKNISFIIKLLSWEALSLPQKPYLNMYNYLLLLLKPPSTKLIIQRRSSPTQVSSPTSSHIYVCQTKNVVKILLL